MSMGMPCGLPGWLRIVLLWMGILMGGHALAQAGLPVGQALPEHAPLLDQAHLLDQAERQDLQRRMRDVERVHGIRVGMILIESLGAQRIEAYANELGNAWRIGAANGVLIVVASKDRRARIEVSQGMAQRLPDALSSRILHEDVMPLFKQARYHQGLSAGLARLDGMLSAGGNAEPESVVLSAAESGISASVQSKAWRGAAVCQVLLFAGLPIVGLLLFAFNGLSWRVCLGVSVLAGAVEWGALSMAETEAGASPAIMMGLTLAVAVWMTLLVAAGLRKLLSKAWAMVGKGSRPSDAAQARGRRKKGGRQRPGKGAPAALVSTARTRQDDERRVFWNTSGFNEDDRSSSSDKDDSSRGGGADFSGDGASSSW